MTVVAFSVVILFFELPYHLEGVEFDVMDTADESRMIKIVRN